MRRLTIFARSVIPRDPNQLLLLVGSILLLICEQLRCYPIVAGYTPGVNVFLLGSYGDPFAKAFHSWLLFSYSVLNSYCFFWSCRAFRLLQAGKSPHSPDSLFRAAAGIRGNRADRREVSCRTLVGIGTFVRFGKGGRDRIIGYFYKPADSWRCSRPTETIGTGKRENQRPN